MTSLSNLIKSKDYSRFDIEAFEEEDFANGLDIPVPEDSIGVLTLPLGNDDVRKAASLSGFGSGQKVASVERMAYEKGFNQGQKDGLALGEKRTEATWKQMTGLFEELCLLKGRIMEETEREIVRLSMAVAGKIIRKEVAMDPDTIRRSVHQALTFLKDKSFVRILINPGDMKTLERFLPELSANNKIQKLELAEDHCIEPGGCILETGFGRVNATIDNQLAELETELEEAFCAGGEAGDGS